MDFNVLVPLWHSPVTQIINLLA